MCSSEQAMDIFREAYQACNDALFGQIESAYLYGSYARGDFDEQSDVDIMLIVSMDNAGISGARSTIASISSRLSLAHDITVSITSKPSEQFNKYRDVLPFYKDVLKEGIRYAV